MSHWLIDASVLLAGQDTRDSNHADAYRLLAGIDPVATLDLAYYETANVAVRSWLDDHAALILRERIAALAADGGLVHGDVAVLESATLIAEEYRISVYDAAYVAAARMLEARLVSCDIRDLVSKGLACLPRDAVSEHFASPP